MLIPVICTLVAFSEAVGHWGYPHEGEEFPKWGGTCDSGYRQSPIDLTISRAYQADYKDLKFTNYERPLLRPKIFNNGHTLKITSDSKLSISGGGLSAEYFLVEMHFHWSSEHTMGHNHKYPLEMHLVHIKSDCNNAKDCLTHPDGIVVLGVLFHISSENSSYIQQIIDEIIPIMPADKVGVHRNISGNVVVKDFLPTNPARNYFTYKGSLTTPPCSEAVIWIVYSNTKPVSLPHVDTFLQVQTSEGKLMTRNARKIQEANDRVVAFVSSSPISGPLYSIFFIIVILVVL